MTTSSGTPYQESFNRALVYRELARDQPLIIKHIGTRLLTLTDIEFEKMNTLLQKVKELPQPKPETFIVMFKLSITGDLSKFANSIDNVAPPIEQAIVSIARQSLSADIVTYRKVIQLILNDPTSDKFAKQIKDAATKLDKLTDRQLLTLGFIIEYAIQNPEGRINNDTEINKKIDVGNSERFPQFLDYLADQKEKGVDINDKNFQKNAVETFFNSSSSTVIRALSSSSSSSQKSISLTIKLLIALFVFIVLILIGVGIFIATRK